MLCINDRLFNLKNTVVTLGKFDGVHKGHMYLINRAVQDAKDMNLQSVLFTFDLNRKSIYPPAEKLDIIKEMGIDVSIIYPFDSRTVEMSASTFIEQVLVGQLDVKKIVVGEDFCFGHNRKGNVKMLEDYGKIYGFSVEKVTKLRYEEGIISSSVIKDCLAKGLVKEASELLGRTYSIRGVVSLGKQLGRTIGFPTANIIPEENVIMPRFGVYKTQIIIDENVYAGITNVGCRPTVNGDYVSVETYIKAFNENIYDRQLQVNFLDFIRPEKRFETVDELKNQINKDLSHL